MKEIHKSFSGRRDMRMYDVRFLLGSGPETRSHGRSVAEWVVTRLSQNPSPRRFNETEPRRIIIKVLILLFSLYHSSPTGYLMLLCYHICMDKETTAMVLLLCFFALGICLSEEAGNHL